MKAKHTLLHRPHRIGRFSRVMASFVVVAVGVLGYMGWQKFSSEVQAMPPAKIVQVAGGTNHSLALASDGTVYAWGSNNYGQLGNNSTTTSKVPVVVTTTDTPMEGKTITAISAGSNYSLALASDGTVYAWGINNYGQLGNNSTTNSSVPVAVTTTDTPMAGKTIMAISSGEYHSLALASDGTVYAWGRNNYGQLGNNFTTSSSVPVAVTTTGTPMASKTITAISAGRRHSLALASDGTVYAWGYNNNGQLGNSSITNSSFPVAIITTDTPMAGKTIMAISSGEYHSLALASDSTVYAWGYNNNGQLGNNSTTSSSIPVQTQLTLYGTPSTPNNLTTTPGNSSVALSWQKPIETYGQTITGYSLRYRPVGSTTWTTTSITGDVTSYTLNSLTNNTKYQLRLAAVTAGGVGDYSNIILATPTNPIITSITPNYGTPSGGTSTTITGTDFALKDKDIVQIAAGYYHTLALDVDGIVYSWGNNNYGQLGDGTLVNRRIPVAVNASGSLAGKRFVKIGAGYDTSFAIDSSGKTYAWGDNNHGQIGRPIAERINPIPTEVDTAGTPMAGKKIVDIVSGQATTVALDSNGVLYSWGYNQHGELGQGTATEVSSSTPGLVATSGNSSIQGKKITSVEAGEYYFLAIDSNGKVHSWGFNQYGEIGNGTQNTSSTSPTLVKTADTPMAGKVIVDVAAGIWHSVAVDSNGQVYTWGDGEFSQLGNGMHGTGVDSLVPVAVVTAGTPMAGKKIVDVAAGGNNYYVEQATPSSHSLAVADDGSVYAWGTNHIGEIGTGTSAGGAQYDKPVAVDVAGTPMAGKSLLTVSAGIFSSVGLSSDGNIYTWGNNSLGQLGDGTVTSRLKPVSVSSTAPSALSPSVPAATFGGTSATNVTLVSPTQITATTSAHAAGLVNVSVDLGSGDSSYTATLANGYTYGDPPSTPTNITTTPGNSSVQLNWSAPIETFGQTITGYSLQYRAEGSSIWITTNISGNVTSYTQSSLTNNQKYQLRLAAVTGAGVGDYSNILLSTPHATPTITSVSPNIGPTAGGTNVTVTGANFQLKNKDIIQTAAGSDHSLALASDGTIYAWGRNDSGQLGNGTTTGNYSPNSLPVAVTTTGTPMAGKTITAISAGYGHSLALASDGTVYAWGYNYYGQLGNSTTTSSNKPVAVTTTGTPMAGKTITAISAGTFHSLALASDGTAYAWGQGANGRLGNGTTTDSNKPVAVTTTGTPMAGKTITAISAGNYHSLALASDGTVYAWGGNSRGQLGNGATTDSTVPVSVTTTGTPMAGKTITAISADSDEYSLALASDGIVYAWGYNYYGLGNDTTTSSNKPVAVTTTGTPMAGKTITAISAGNYHSIALASDGTVYAWGRGSSGQLGNGTTANSTIPVAVTTTGTPMAGKTITAISGGSTHSLALASDGTVYAWGGNSRGQLGNGATTMSNLPVAVTTTAPSALAPSIPAATFGGAPATNVVLVSPTQITTTTPAHAAGLVDVSVDLGSGDSSYIANLTNSYTYGDPPSAPVSMVAAPQDSGVRLSWSVPTSNGGFPITNYIVQYSADGGATWNTYNDGISTSTTVTVPSPTPLNAATNYTFRVSAANTIGQGGWSNTTTGRVRYITVSAPASVVLNVTPTGDTRMSSSSHNVTVSTNGALGYNLLLSSTSTNRNLVNGSSSITPTAGSQVSPTNLSNSSWGYRVPGIGGFGTGSGLETNTTVSSYTWAGIPANGSPATIRTQTSAVNNDSATVWYGVSITPDQRSGSYTSTVVYTAVTRD